ncbi:MAG TPA: phosphopantetheine-binding protein [Streptosporangiaceae bacterium]
MNTIDDFLTLVRDELGLPVTMHDAGLNLDQVAGWDSMHLLWLLTVLEQRTGRSLPLAALLEAESLEDIYSLVVTE